MRYPFLKSIIAAMIVGLFTLSAYAQYSTKEAEVFQEACNKTWMERAGNAKDKVAFQNFGEKYCKCAVDKPLKSDADVEKAAHACMAQTLLRDAMDSIEAQQGLANLTEDKILAACQDKWTLVYPEREPTKYYCQCAAPKLMAVNNATGSTTDTQWADKINQVANECAGKV